NARCRRQRQHTRCLARWFHHLVPVVRHPDPDRYSARSLFYPGRLHPYPVDRRTAGNRAAGASRGSVTGKTHHTQATREKTRIVCGPSGHLHMSHVPTARELQRLWRQVSSLFGTPFPGGAATKVAVGACASWDKIPAVARRRLASNGGVPPVAVQVHRAVSTASPYRF